MAGVLALSSPPIFLLSSLMPFLSACSHTPLGRPSAPQALSRHSSSALRCAD